jgi:hypothetical protein
VVVKNSQPLDEIPVGGNNTTAFNAFEDKPITKNNNNTMSEYPTEGEAPIV